MAHSIGQDVSITGSGGGPAYAALPQDATRGMVVIHEIFGRQPEIDRVVERFAARGYAAVAPDLFGDRFKPACVRAAMRAVHSGHGPEIDQIRRAREWLCETTKLPVERVGLIGFCMGGGFALAAGSGWAAVSTNYGDVPATEVMRGIGPVIGCYGGRDRAFRKAPELLRERLSPLGVNPEVHVYADAGHAFLTDGHHPIAEALSFPLLHVQYNPAIAEDAWARIFSFFDRQLA